MDKFNIYATITQRIQSNKEIYEFEVKIMLLKDHNKTALYYNDIAISYSEVIENTAKFAAQNNLQSGERTVIFAENLPEWVYSLYSVWYHGAIPVPFDYMAPAEELSYVIDDCTPATIFCSEKTRLVAEKAVEKSKHKPKILLMENCIKKSIKSIPKEIPMGADNDIAVLIYTSGTTGSPKGAMLTFKNLQVNFDTLCELEKLGSRDTLIFKESCTLMLLPAHHILPLQGEVIIPMHVGATSIVINRLNPEEIVASMKKYKIDYLVGVPRLYEMFYKGIMKKINASIAAKIVFRISKMTGSLKVGQKLLKKVYENFGGNIKFLVSGGAPLPPGMAEDYHAMGLLVLNGYGMTEASPLISHSRIFEYKLNSVGRPIPGSEVKIVDDEICFKGENVMKGYWNKPDETAKVLINGWLHTGDRGFIDKDGYLQITGRLKDIIVLPNGKNINPEEIEDKIKKSSPLISDIGVTMYGNSLHAVIFPDKNVAQELSVVNVFETIKWEVVDLYNRAVPNYKKIIDLTISPEELPRTRMGKLRRFLLKDVIENKTKKSSTEAIPNIPVYNDLVKIIEETASKKVSPSDHIEYDLGLDSLGKVELQVQLESTFGIKLSDDIFSHYAIVKDLAQYIQDTRTTFNENTINWKQILNDNLPSGKINTTNILLNMAVYLFRPFMRIYFLLSAKGIENIPQNVPIILAPNHQSHLDGLVLTAMLPRKIRNNTYSIAKDRNFPTALHRFFAKRANIFLMNINSNTTASIQSMGWLLQNNKNVLIFPEGVRSRDGKIAPFKKTFAILSKELNIPIVPVVINGSYKCFPVGRKFPLPGKISIEFLKPINRFDSNYDIITHEVEKVISDKL